MEETEEASEETEEIESLEEIEETSDLHEEVSTGRPSLLLKSRISMTSLLWESLLKKRGKGPLLVNQFYVRIATEFQLFMFGHILSLTINRRCTSS